VFLLKAAARPRKTSLRRRFAKWVNSVVGWLVRAWVLKEFRARGAGIGGDERVSGTMYRAVAAERDKWPGFSVMPSRLFGVA